MPRLDDNFKHRILAKLTSSRFWGSLVVTAVATVALFTLLPDSIEFKLGCLFFIMAAWGLYDFSKKVVP